MKKSLLLFFVLVLSTALMAQRYTVKEKYRNATTKHVFQETPSEPVGIKSASLLKPVVHQEFPDNPNVVSIIPIGQGGNAFGLSGGGRTTLWAENAINSVGFVHRMATDANYGNSRIAFDLSKDGGASWWNNIQVYAPTGAPLPGQTYPQCAGRYPQGGIFNPHLNTIPDNAYFHQFSPTIDNSNGTWGGYGYGVRKLDTLQTFTQHNSTSTGNYLHNVPDAFTITSTGKAFVVEPVAPGGIASAYNGNLIIEKGIWNTNTNDFDYTESLMPFPTFKYIIDSKIAFAPDGQTGYMSFLTHHDWNFLSDSAYYPVLFKTTDGGNTWSNAIPVMLGGANGIPAVLNYLSDSMLAVLYNPPIPPRDSILFTTAFDHDLVVDANGNPHIGVVIGPGSGGWSIYSSRDLCGIFDIFSPDGGTTWQGVYCDSIKCFRGEFTGTSTLSEDNRAQISRTASGNKVFVSWLDTETPGSTTNTEPNIYCKGIDAGSGVTTNTFNVTKFTLAYAQAFMGSQSHMVFTNGTEYTIPFVYQEMNPAQTGDPVQYQYVHNFKITDAQFTGINDNTPPAFSISQNYPNPFRGQTQISVELPKAAKVGVQVINLLGQTVARQEPGFMSKGNHTLNIDASGLNAGVYFYTVTVGNEKISRKMIVR